MSWRFTQNSNSSHCLPVPFSIIISQVLSRQYCSRFIGCSSVELCRLLVGFVGNRVFLGSISSDPLVEFKSVYPSIHLSFSLLPSVFIDLPPTEQLTWNHVINEGKIRQLRFSVIGHMLEKLQFLLEFREILSLSGRAISFDVEMVRHASLGNVMKNCKSKTQVKLNSIFFFILKHYYTKVEKLLMK